MGKTQQRIPIPEPLRAFLRDVQSQIDAGDEATTIESDDLLQTHRSWGGPVEAYGGLVDAQGGLYCFRYFHGDEEDGPPTWDFCLTRHEIQQIADGSINHLSMWKCASPDCKCLYEIEEAYCRWCDTASNSN